MTDSTQAARDDLAFLRALTEDRGPLPWSAGAHSLAIGLIFGANLIGAWALQFVMAYWPMSWVTPWLPGTGLYLLAYLFIRPRSRGETFGPSARMVGTSWLAVHAMTLFIILALLAAHAGTGTVFERIWPAIAWSLYGGAWTVAALVRREVWAWVAAAGSFAFALAIASLIDSPDLLLVMGLAALWTFALPGVLMLRRAARAA